MKSLIKKLVKKIPIAFTKNQQYDRDTNLIIKKVLKKDSNCIDVGCHKGEVLETILKFAPNGHHLGFEPIPHFYKNLVATFTSQKTTPAKCDFHSIALSDKTGETSFNYVISNPSYSGIKKRRYDKPDEKDVQIKVKTELLDNILEPGLKIDLIKIDVEGAEFLVLKGAEKTIKRHKPVIIFEHGIGGADCYNIRPEQVFDFLDDCGMNIFLLSSFLKTDAPLSRTDFVQEFDNERNYYFVANSK